MRIQEMTQNASSRKTQRNSKEIKESWRKIENPRNDKACDFQQNAKELEGDREKQEKECESEK